MARNCNGGCGKIIADVERCIVFTKDKYTGDLDETFSLGKNVPQIQSDNLWVSCMSPDCRRRIVLKFDNSI